MAGVDVCRDWPREGSASGAPAPATEAGASVGVTDDRAGSDCADCSRPAHCGDSGGARKLPAHTATPPPHNLSTIDSSFSHFLSPKVKLSRRIGSLTIHAPVTAP